MYLSRSAKICPLIGTGTSVQVDGLEADDGSLIVLLVLAVSWQSRISWKEETGSALVTWLPVLSVTDFSRDLIFLTDGELLSSKVKHETALLLVVGKPRPASAFGRSLTNHIPVLVPARQR